MADVGEEIGRLGRPDLMARERAIAVRAQLARIGPSVRGPLATLAVAIGFDLLARGGVPILHPFAFLLVTIVYAAISGGVRPGLVSALIGIVYAIHFLSLPQAPLTYTPVQAYTLLAMSLVMPATAIAVAHWRRAGAGSAGTLSREEAIGLERRLSFFSQAHAVLASSLDYEATLHTLAKMSVPALADWCAIHLVNEHGDAQFIAGAHRDPSRDLIIRALAEHAPKRLPFGPVAEHPVMLDVTTAMVDDLAIDADHRKLYGALATTSVIVAPMRARGRTVGVITLGASNGYGRRYGADDLRMADELASRAALAVDNARLFHDGQEAETRYRMLFESNPQSMWVFDAESLAFLAVNDAAVRHYGYSREEFLAMTVIDLRPADDLPGLQPSSGEHTGGRRAEMALAQHQRKDGTIVEMELVSHELEVHGRRARLVLATDVTERSRARSALHRSEERLWQVQRMDAVGRLAGGIAHDFNNLLTTIRGFSEILLKDFTPADARSKDVEQIRRAADRGTQLTRQLLAFGQQQMLQPRPLVLNDIVTAIDVLLQRLLGADIQLVTHLQADIGLVQMDPGQLEQVLVNLVLNARDAMPSGGTLTIETFERQIARTGRARNLRPGSYVVLAVTDTGKGMEGETLQHLFEPFFTDKPQGQRAGLGLAIVYGIVRQSGGVIRVASEPGHGTTVKIYLPRMHDAEESPSLQPPKALRGTETVLIVEDEDGVRELLRKILVEHGHAVLDARHGRDALLVADRYQHAIQLLVTDVVMPEMGGGQLAEELLARRPGLKVLFISGYTDDEIIRRGVRQADAAFLHKPFTADELMKKIRSLLESPAAADSRPSRHHDGSEIRP